MSRYIDDNEQEEETARTAGPDDVFSQVRSGFVLVLIGDRCSFIVL